MTESSSRENLRRLAARLGILDSYFDIRGGSHPTSDATREALVAAMGLDASTEASAAHTLARLDAEDAANAIDPVQVWRQWSEGAPGLRVRVPHGARDWEIELRREDGRIETARGRFDPAAPPSTHELSLPLKPSEGYHAVRITLETEAGPIRAEQLLVLSPRTCVDPKERIGERRSFGIVANLYSMRTRDDDGIGDLGALDALVRLAGRSGADFVGVNPLHALRNRGLGVSPYSPVSRLYRNPLYIALESVPEFDESPAARAMLGSAEAVVERTKLRTAPRVDYEAVRSLKLRVLEELHRRFAAAHRGRGTARGRAFEVYREREGDALVDFATFCAIEDAVADGAGEHVPFDLWPEGLADPRSARTARFRAEHAEAISFHAYLQFELDRQLEESAALSRRSGLAIGVYQDLAIGLAPDAADVWAFPGLFARGASVGAPPDDYAPQGQDWGLPPLDPRALRAGAYGYWIRLLRAAFAHAGALRIDHVMGLFRLFWIPRGASGAAGAYVRYPADDLLGILALESRRHHAIVVGEDLGTVPDEVPRALASWNVLSSRVLLFERDGPGFRPAASYPARAMVTANTHDLPTFAAWLDGEDLELRVRLGLAAREDLDAACSDRRSEVAALEARLREEGTLGEGVGEPSATELRDATDIFLCRTPCALAGIPLDDLAGERDPVNVPGVGMAEFSSWSRRMRSPIEDLAEDPGVVQALAAAARERPR